MWRGLGSILKEPCAQSTLFLLPVREEIPWMRSALKQVCWHHGWAPRSKKDFWKTSGIKQQCVDQVCAHTCGDERFLNWALRHKPDELSWGPHNWIEEWMVLSTRYHTYMFDIDTTDNVLACFPPGGLKVEHSSTLGSHIYKRDDPVKSSNDGFRPSINMSDNAVLAAYTAAEHNHTHYWVQPYAKAIKESRCAVASFSAATRGR